MKKLKKSWAMYVGTFALVLALSAASFVGYSYSKYTKTAGNGGETATVAAFGVTLEGNGSLFAKTYAATAETTALDPAITASVVSTGDTFAPGTENVGEGYKLSATVNNNEVAVQINFDLDFTVANWTVGPNDFAYEPVKFTVKKTTPEGVKYLVGAAGTVAENDTEGTATASQLATYFASDIAAINLAPGQNNYSVEYVITWEWAFESANIVAYMDEQGDYHTTNEGGTYIEVSGNELDTLLGEAEAKATINFTGSVTAEQLD